ncbi:MAG: polysaccharide biosynthesis protein, partial [Duncaniella sp.]|nr:polysaccharide biosynthesis protein [Duncaniella sp.]
MTGLRATAKLFYDLYVRRLTGGGAYGYSDKDLISMEMADLLQREPIEVNMSGISRALGGRSILVTGAAGSIGSELSMLLASCRPSQLVLIDQAESPLHKVRIELERLYPDLKCATIVTNICHIRRMEKIFAAYRPEYVFHAAAYKHVPMMEDNPVESVLNNVDGTRKIADLAVRYGVGKFVMISTDKAVNPTSVMGCSKRICEMYCQSLSEAQTTTQFITTRFGNVLGSNGSVIPTFRDQIRRGGPVLVTHPDIIRYFMLIPEAWSLVLEAATIGRGGEIFAFDMGSPVR